MNNLEVYDNLQAIIKDHAKKEMALKELLTIIKLVKDGEAIDLDSVMLMISKSLE